MHRFDSGRFIFFLAAAALKVLDVPFAVLHTLRRTSVAPLAAPESDTWPDEEIIRLVDTAPYLEGSDDKLVKISDDTVVKFGRDWESTCSEALAMNLVRTQTRILVPRVRRTIRHLHPEGEGLIVMDVVPHARQLKSAWPSLSLWKKLDTILTLRLYLRQLRNVRHGPSEGRPGPLGSVPAPCNGLQFGYDPRGPFPTPSALRNHFKRELEAANERASRGQAPAPNCRPLDASSFDSLVFTHNDLNLRNILLDNHAYLRLWIVDWGWAGLYPRWFEYLGMRFAAQKDQEPESWQACIQHIAEPAFAIERWMYQIGYDY